MPRGYVTFPISLPLGSVFTTGIDCSSTLTEVVTPKVCSEAHDNYMYVSCMGRFVANYSYNYVLFLPFQ